MRTQNRPTIEQLERLYVQEGLTTQQIGDQLGFASQTIQKWLRKAGIQVRPRGTRPGHLHPFWKGGVTVDKQGYILRYSPQHPQANSNGYIRDHRLVMERKLGRQLLPSEVVHHRDDDPSNNHPDNLELFQSNSDHLSQTISGRCPNWTEEGLDRLRKATEGRRKKLPPIAELTAMYETLTTRQIAERLGCSSSLIQRKLRQAGVGMLGYKERCAKKWPTPDEVQRLVLLMPAVQVAVQLGVDQQTLYAWMHRNGVRTQRQLRKQMSATPRQC